MMKLTNMVIRTPVRDLIFNMEWRRAPSVSSRDGIEVTCMWKWMSYIRQFRKNCCFRLQPLEQRLSLPSPLHFFSTIPKEFHSGIIIILNVSCLLIVTYISMLSKTVFNRFWFQSSRCTCLEKMLSNSESMCWKYGDYSF